VPIWSQRGRGGGYAIDSRWNLPPLNFDATEALAVIAALAAARTMPFADAGRRAERKLLAAMMAPEAAKARQLASRLRLSSFGTRVPTKVVAAVEQAVVDRRVVTVEYRDRTGEISTREVEAHGLHLSTTGSYLLAWCRLRDDGRAFRLDRIVSIRPTTETAPPRDIDGLVDWVDDAHSPDQDARSPDQRENDQMTASPKRRSWGPPRRTDNRTGSTPAFASAIAASLPGVTAKTSKQRSKLAVAGEVFASIDATDESLTIHGDRTFLLPQIGRDETRSLITDAWERVAPASDVTAHRRRTAAWQRRAAVTADDVRKFVLSLPDAVEGPIWGSDVGFLIGTEKRTRFARFGPPISGRPGNLLPPDDEDTLVILRCPQRPALLASAPDRYFITPHYGDPSEPGAVIVRLCEHRGRGAFEELCALLEDAYLDAKSIAKGTR
jgi:hypothetical protein